ncbi:hypothetical protein EVAR_27859_1 [Eumeta japonica]|uniref:Uncharacterized protein n=1 Tax=Eumeta variegata TaxID=151549 RepID=A0A4C1VJV1_EUMVA|nr:hypothetical protein EVAR_27859_1 [Eumeta japonica]
MLQKENAKEINLKGRIFQRIGYSEIEVSNERKRYEKLERRIEKKRKKDRGNGCTTRCLYFSDGAPEQFKNVKRFSNIYYHNDFRSAPEWHFHATEHGKGPCDGAGGALKRMALRASSQMTPEEQTSTLLELYEWTNKKSSLKNMPIMQRILLVHCQRYEGPGNITRYYLRAGPATWRNGAGFGPTGAPSLSSNGPPEKRLAGSFVPYKVLAVSRLFLFDANGSLKLRGDLSVVTGRPTMLGVESEVARSSS